MGFLNWYDWIMPTNPYASIFFGIIFTVLIAIIAWFDRKEIKTIVIVVVTGLSVTLIGVVILIFFGYYV